MKEIASYEDFCKAFKGKSEEHERAILLLFVQDWINKVITNIDENSIDCTLDEMFQNSVYKGKVSAQKDDALSYISNQVEDACKNIFYNMHEKIVRENVLLPIHKVKEVNGYGINWLSRKPGRTVREKMSGNNSIMAVQRRMSIDTGENRLLLAFVKEFRELLQFKIDNMPESYIDVSETNFYQLLSSFLKFEGNSEIRRWENLPPNNTLLSDNNYKKVWIAWNEIKNLDLFIEDSNVNIDRRLSTLFYIELILESKNYFCIPQVPLEVKYHDYKISVESHIFYGIDANDDSIRIKRKDNEIFVEYKENILHIMFKKCRMYLSINSEELSNIHINAGNIKKYVSLVMIKLGCTKRKDIRAFNSTGIRRYRDVVIDLFSVHPEYIADDQPIEKMKTRILQQKFCVINQDVEDVKEYYASCNDSDALLILENIVETYTLTSAVNASSKEQMKRLILMLEKNFLTDHMTFLFPDVFDEFQLSMVHKAARLAYRKVRAFPKSIGVVFQFQESKVFESLFSENDFVLVVDLIDDEVTFTLVKGVFDEELYKEINDYKGIMWERHPTFSIPCKEFVEEIQDKLLKRGCEKPELLYKIFGKKGLREETDNLICIFGDDRHFRITGEVVKAVDSVVINITDMVSKFLHKRKDIIGNSKVHVISLTDTFIFKGIGSYQVYCDSDSLLGYSKYQELKKNIRRALWKDHLPDLAIKLLYGRFDLVNQATVLPSFNAIQEIKIKNTFILVKNKKKYQFQLVQNDMNSKIQYEAVIKQAAFPLKQDVECKLRMTYRYGAEEPYELVFVPLEKKQAGFIEAKVEWNPISQYDYMDLEYPEFPDVKSWSKMQQFPKKYIEGYEDLTSNLAEIFERINKGYLTVNLKNYGEEWKIDGRGKHYLLINQVVGDETVTISFSENNFEKDEKFNSHINKVSFELIEANRYTIDLREAERNSIWFDKGKGYCCYRNYYIGNEEKKVAFFQNQFENPDEFTTDVYLVTFELIPFKDMYTAINIRIGANNNRYYKAQNIRKGNKPSSLIVSGRNLFAMHEVFFGGRTINDVDCPDKLKIEFKLAKEKWLEMYRVCDNYIVKNKMFSMMSMVASSLGEGYFNIATEAIQLYLDGDSKLNDALGYALGDYTNNYQKELFNSVVKLKPEKVICILSKAVWKNENFIFNIPTVATFHYFKISVDLLEIACDNYEMSTDRDRFQATFDITMYLEYVLAVFRLRQWNDNQLCKELSLNNPSLQRLYVTIERIIDMGIIIKSRLQLEIDKKGDFEENDIPDLLFVLLVYVTGNKGSSDIKISGVNGDD